MVNEGQELLLPLPSHVILPKEIYSCFLSQHKQPSALCICISGSSYKQQRFLPQAEKAPVSSSSRSRRHGEGGQWLGVVDLYAGIHPEVAAFGSHRRCLASSTTCTANQMGRHLPRLPGPENP